MTPEEEVVFDFPNEEEQKDLIESLRRWIKVFIGQPEVGDAPITIFYLPPSALDPTWGDRLKEACTKFKPEDPLVLLGAAYDFDMDELHRNEHFIELVSRPQTTFVNLVGESIVHRVVEAIRRVRILSEKGE